jgi:hypothetical protein
MTTSRIGILVLIDRRRRLIHCVWSLRSKHPNARRAMALAMICTMAACSDGSPSAIASSATSTPPTSSQPPVVDGGTITVTEKGCTYEPSGEPLVAGTVSFTVVNETGGLGAANIAAISSRADFRRLEGHIAEEIDLAEQGLAGLGHPGYAVPMFDAVLDAGATGALEGPLDEGLYAMTCAKLYPEVGELRPNASIGPIEVTA